MPTGLPGSQAHHAWLSTTNEPPLEPELRIVDAHHHLWGPPRPPYLVDDMLTDIGLGHHVAATVYIDAREGYDLEAPEDYKPVGETRYASGLAEESLRKSSGRTTIGAAIVSHANLLIGSPVGDVLDAHISAGDGKFRGIRHLAAADDYHPIRPSAGPIPQPGLLGYSRFREGFAELAPRELSFDAWVVFHQLSEVADLARAFPNTSIILNHVGTPLGVGPYKGMRERDFDEWRRGIAAVAECENVTVKLGGLSMKFVGFNFHKNRQAPSSSQLATAWKSYIDHCIQEFGPDRCMFESNFPVDSLNCSYGNLWNAFKRLTAPYSTTERIEMFAGTAERIYRIS